MLNKGIFFFISDDDNNDHEDYSNSNNKTYIEGFELGVYG